jgi:hypothetical protein
LLSLAGLVIYDQATAGGEPYWNTRTSHSRCEETRGNENNFLRERANALSNLVFMNVGVYCIACATYDARHIWLRRAPPRAITSAIASGDVAAEAPASHPGSIAGGIAQQPLLSVAYGVSIFLGGYGSFVYHASAGSPFGGQLDIWSIFVMCNAVVFLMVGFTFISLAARSLPNGAGPKVNTVASLLLVSFTVFADDYCWEWYEHFWQGSWDAMYALLMKFLGGMVVIYLLLIFTLCVLKIKHRIWPFVVLSALTLVAGVLVWVPEEINDECPEIAEQGATSFWQLHAIWHSMLALTLLFVFMYFRGIGLEVRSAEEGGVFGLGLSEMDFHLLWEPTVEGEPVVGGGGRRGLGGKGEEWVEREVFLGDNYL